MEQDGGQGTQFGTSASIEAQRTSTERRQARNTGALRGSTNDRKASWADLTEEAYETDSHPAGVLSGLGAVSEACDSYLPQTMQSSEGLKVPKSCKVHGPRPYAILK